MVEFNFNRVLQSDGNLKMSVKVKFPDPGVTLHDQKPDIGDSLRHQIPTPCPHSPLTGFTLIGALHIFITGTMVKVSNKIHTWLRGWEDWNKGNHVKGRCHEDITVLGQFCAYLLPLLKQMSSGALTILVFLVIFYRYSIIASFNSCPSLPSVATENSKQFQCLKIVLNNKTRPLL